MAKCYHSLIFIISLFIIVSCSTESTPVYTLGTFATPEEGGTVTPQSGEYDEGTSVEITASPNEGWVFSGWQGQHSGTQNPDTIIINSDKEISALFEKREYPLTIHREGEGSVSEKVLQAKTTDYPHGTVVELTAEPDDGWELIGWSGDIESTDDVIEITIESETNITVTFERLDYPLTITIEGEGDVEQKIVSSPKTTEYPFETIVELTAKPEEGWSFYGWSGDVESTEEVIEVTIESETNITATFERKDYPLNITIEGEGRVEQSVITTPKSTDYPFETVVELSPIPSEGFRFVEWGGDFSGNDKPLQITIDGEKNITVKFSPIAFLAENGITVMCPHAEVGDIGIVNGVEYEVVDRELLIQRIEEGRGTLNKRVCVTLITNMNSLFEGLNFNQPIGDWDVSNVTNMNLMFRNSQFNRPIQDWDVSNVTGMIGMFQLSQFNQSIENWDVSSVTNMNGMFGGSQFNQSVANWNVSNVTDMWGMFFDTPFNHPIGDWDVENVTRMDWMFRNSQFNQNISNWCVWRIGSEPSAFSSGSPLTDDNKPVWGTCPD